MSQIQIKPLNNAPGPEVGFSAQRRLDGGMHIIFHRVDPETLKTWREFAMAHLEDSDRLTTNLYDLREIQTIPEDAIRYALEVNSDPSVRNIRLAVVASNERVARALHEIDALSAGYGVEMGVFSTMEEAEAWLDRPLTLLS